MLLLQPRQLFIAHCTVERNPSACLVSTYSMPGHTVTNHKQTIHKSVRSKVNQKLWQRIVILCDSVLQTVMYISCFNLSTEHAEIRVSSMQGQQEFLGQSPVITSFQRAGCKNMECKTEVLCQNQGPRTNEMNGVCHGPAV